MSEDFKPTAPIGSIVVAWNFERTNAMRGELINYVDDRYQVTFRWYNQRLGRFMTSTRTFAHAEPVIR